MTLEQLEDRFELCNLLDAWPGRARSGPGDAFPLSAARAAARDLAPSLDGATALLAGRGVAAAFGVRAVFFEPIVVELGGARFVAVVIPHPSGLSRWWNAPANLARARAELRRLAA